MASLRQINLVGRNRLGRGGERGFRSLPRSMAQIMAGQFDWRQAGFAMWLCASTSSPTLHRQLQALRPIWTPLQCRSRAVHPGTSLRTMQALAANPTVPSWLTSPSGQHRGARFGQALVSGQRLHHAQAPWRATRTLRATRNRERAFSGSAQIPLGLRPALRVLSFAVQRNCDLTPKTTRPRRHLFPLPVSNLDPLPKPLWMRRGAQGQADQGPRLSERSEC